MKQIIKKILIPFIVISYGITLLYPAPCEGIFSEGSTSYSGYLGHYSFNKDSEYATGLQFGAQVRGHIFKDISLSSELGFIKTMSKNNAPITLSTLLRISGVYPLKKYNNFNINAHLGLHQLAFNQTLSPIVGIETVFSLSNQSRFFTQINYEKNISILMGYRQYTSPQIKPKPDKINNEIALNKLDKLDDTEKPIKKAPPPFKSPLMIHIKNNFEANVNKNTSNSTLKWLNLRLNEYINTKNSSTSYIIEKLEISKNSSASKIVSRLEAGELISLLKAPLFLKSLSPEEQKQYNLEKESLSTISLRTETKNSAPKVISIQSFIDQTLQEKNNIKSSLWRYVELPKSNEKNIVLEDIEKDYLFYSAISEIIRHKHMGSYETKTGKTFKSNAPILKHHFIIFMARVYEKINKDKGLSISPNIKQRPLLPKITRADRIKVSAMINAFNLTPSQLTNNQLRKPLTRKDAITLSQEFLNWYNSIQ